ncbi:LSU ribosomal protein L7AE [Mariprofundus aestuarium]|uniref:LSU ribosomal protein L7AE n=2 Tax=Mariprofundus aestuarium TaxID=1921086 RepID=A0A2K8KXV3_MARES|nr:LSU ribosomal protein L7AE [Mariprofundus aestuarium]
MLRLIVDDEGQLWPDLLQKLPGRGVYLCMQAECLNGMSDRRLQPLKAKFKVDFPQWEKVKERLVSILHKQLLQMFTRLRVKTEIGRDAVMHRLWNNAPVLLLIATDAGDAVVRQIEDAVEKREQAGHKSRTLSVESKQWLGEMLGRDSVAVAALGTSGMMATNVRKLNQYCGWYGQLKVIG